MGWSGGSRLFSEVIKVIKPEVTDVTKRKKMYLKLIDAFTDEDWDTLDECEGEDKAYDAAYAQWRKKRGYDED